MFYLKANLDGEPSRLIQHVGTSGEYYQMAWKILVDRYDNKRLQITAFLDKFLNQVMVDPATAKSLRKLHDTTKECTMGLENLGIEIGSWGPMIHHLLIKKQDLLTHSQYERSLADPKSVPQLQDLLSFLDIRANALDAMGSN